MTEENMSLTEPKPDFDFDEELVHLCGLMDLDINDTNKTHKDSFLARKVLYSIQVHEVHDLHRAKCLLSLMKNEAWLKKANRPGTLMDLVYISAWWDDNDIEDVKGAEKEHILAAGNKYMSNSYKNESVKIPVSLQDLPRFSGKSDDWFEWKVKAMADFRLTGMAELLGDGELAKQNPIQNSIIHAMLVKAVVFEGSLVSYVPFIGDDGDGYAAWKHLTNVYESPEQLKNILRDAKAKLDSLKFRDGNSFLAFQRDFVVSLRIFFSCSGDS